MKQHFCIIFVLVSLLMATAIAFAGYMICPQCGWEQADTRIECVHCGAELASEPRAGEEPDDPASYGKDKEKKTEPGERETAAFVRRCFSLAKERLEKGRLLEAELFFRNAMAVNATLSTNGVTDLGPGLLRGIEICESRARISPQRCPACGGSGRRELRSEGLSGGIPAASASVPCDLCRGNGRISGIVGVSKLKYQKAKAARIFRRHQVSRGNVRVGNVWMPEAMESNLSLEDRVALKQSWPDGCRECAGYGTVQCEGCSGTGWIECTNEACEDGYILNLSTKKTLGTKSGSRRKCSVCKGTSVIRCDECNGKGTVICESCQGQGTGAKCRQCDGAGLIKCSRCSGNGMVEGQQCPECGGAGFLECRSCRGYGRD